MLYLILEPILGRVDMRCRIWYGMVALLLLLARPAAAHDFWLEPESFRPRVGSQVPVRIYVGEHFKGNSSPYPERFERYVYISQGKEQTVPGVLGDDPAGSVPVTAPGVIIIGYRGPRNAVSFDTVEEFERYLVKEGMERVIPLNRQRRKTKNINEVYSRCAKSLIAAGDLPAAARGHPGDKVLGFRLELIAEANPYAHSRTATIPVRLLFDGKPLAGALIKAFTKAEPQRKLSARTDAQGRATFTLPGSGVWLFTSVHMITPPAEIKADWESLWASLSFALP